MRVMEGSAIQAACLVLFSEVEVVSSRISVRVLGPAGGGEAEVSEGPGGGDWPAKEGLRQVPHYARVGRTKGYGMGHDHHTTLPIIEVIYKS